VKVDCVADVSEEHAASIIRTEVRSVNQPTYQNAKGGVLRKRETSSLVRSDHSCVRNAMLEMVNRDLQITWDVLTLTGLLSGSAP
jgi:hypothetical protein